jgi:hypothetical protein
MVGAQTADRLCRWIQSLCTHGPVRRRAVPRPPAPLGGKVVAWTLILSIAFVPAARGWVVDQATRHAMHNIEPMIGNLMSLSAPPSAPRPAVRNIEEGRQPFEPGQVN